MAPGALVAIGGNEDKQQDLKVLRTICSLPDGGTKTVEIIPTASSIPKEVAEAYIQAFGKIGVPNTHVLHIDRRSDANAPDTMARIKAADLVFFTGGDQLRITSLLGGSLALRSILEHYHNGGVVAGTSAGAACMSATMIFEGDPSGSMHKGNVQMVPGLGLLKTSVIDTHFIQRGRLSRLLEVVVSNPGMIGVGLSEDTAIIVRGALLEVIGKGVVVVVDGHRLGHTNISDIEMRGAIAAENLIVHALPEGYQYDLDEQRFIPPPPKPVIIPSPTPEVPKP
ncbi:MAG TPA: cyanophycinase [Candidatus Thermoplasmatota archaeon]|nr:cyanophycinase [Candidatus Thermoplasmatota archaeon]